MTLGPVHLTTTDLPRAVAFYERSIGLVTRHRSPGHARLGTPRRDLLVLVEDRRAVPARHHAGLFHLALLFPTRLALSHALRRLVASGAAIEGAADHGVSEAIYLSDPDGNGIELYADRPRDRWPAPAPGGDDRVGMYTVGLDLHGLLGRSDGEAPPGHADPGLAIGHVHLHVGDLDAAVAFYADALGLERTATIPRAAFMAADGYHHHLGLNTWRGQGVPPTPPGSVGLRHWTVLLPNHEALQTMREHLRSRATQADDDGGLRITDPAGTVLHIAVTPDPDNSRAVHDAG